MIFGTINYIYEQPNNFFGKIFSQNKTLNDILVKFNSNNTIISIKDNNITNDEVILSNTKKYNIYNSVLPSYFTVKVKNQLNMYKVIENEYETLNLLKHIFEEDNNIHLIETNQEGELFEYNCVYQTIDTNKNVLSIVKLKKINCLLFAYDSKILNQNQFLFIIKSLFN